MKSVIIEKVVLISPNSNREKDGPVFCRPAGRVILSTNKAESRSRKLQFSASSASRNSLITESAVGLPSKGGVITEKGGRNAGYNQRHRKSRKRLTRNS